MKKLTVLLSILALTMPLLCNVSLGKPVSVTIPVQCTSFGPHSLTGQYIKYWGAWKIPSETDLILRIYPDNHPSKSIDCKATLETISANEKQYTIAGDELKFCWKNYNFLGKPPASSYKKYEIMIDVKKDQDKKWNYRSLIQDQDKGQSTPFKKCPDVTVNPDNGNIKKVSLSVVAKRTNL